MIAVETRISLPDQTFLEDSERVFSRAVHETAVLAEMHAKRLQSGPVLNVRSGFLSTRTNAQVEVFAGGYLIRLGNPQKYARILELGGRTRPHLIRPRRADGVLRFQRGGQTVFARFVRHPGSTFKPRPTLRPALEAEGAKLGERIARARADLPAGPTRTLP